MKLQILDRITCTRQPKAKGRKEATMRCITSGIRSILLCLVALLLLAVDAKAQRCSLKGEWQLTDAATKNNGRVFFAEKEGKLTATYKGSLPAPINVTGPTPADQERPLSKLYCDHEFITFQVQSWGEFWFFRKEKDRAGVKWIGRLRRNDEDGASEAVFFPIGGSR